MSHYLVFSLNRIPARSLSEYVSNLVVAGIRVSLFLVDEAAVESFHGLVAPGLGFEVRALLRSESSLLMCKLCRLLGGYGDWFFVALVRPWLLGRRWRVVRGSIDVASVERLVVVDVSATTLAWQLSRHYPEPMATTQLDVPPPAVGR